MVEANNTLMHAALDSLKSAIAPPLPRASNAPYKGNMSRRQNTTKRIGKLQRFLDSCMHGRMTDSEQSVFLSAKTELKSLLDKDEQYWAQRSRVNWLQFGDRNSAYFHARASGRKKKNRIRGLFSR
ncbi:hypothetical protein V6N13_040362 [Hibiscus sabdariffa]